MAPILVGSAVISQSSGHVLFLGALLKTRTDVLPGVRQGLLASVSSVSCPLAGFTHQ